MNTVQILALALVLDALAGEPRWLWSRLPHPVVLLGRAVDRLERRLNRGRHRRARGVVALAVLLAGASAAGVALEALPAGPLPELLVLTVLLAQRSLVEHVQAVADALHRTPEEARRTVARIVGRDTGQMDEPAIARAAIESAAENFADGVVAPAFWFLLLGLPGVLACKAVNTADSMIGHMSARYRRFGWASARLDDLMNWLPARIGALLILLAHGCIGALPAIRRDAAQHRSPNAGWPEAAMAVALGVALAGPRSYGGRMRDFSWINPAGRSRIGAGEIHATVRALWRAWALGGGLVLLVAIA